MTKLPPFSAYLCSKCPWYFLKPLRLLLNGDFLVFTDLLTSAALVCGLIVLSSIDNGWLLFPSGVRFGLSKSCIPVNNATHLLISWDNIILGWVHFCLVCKEIRNNFFHLDQNLFLKCWTHRCHFFECKSAEVNFLGGGKATFGFKVRKWFGTMLGSAVSDDVVPSPVWGWLLAAAFASYMVHKASLFIWSP